MIGLSARSDAAELSDEQLLEELQGFGLVGGRAEFERLCEGALSAGEVALALLDRCGSAAGEGRGDADWIWLCLLELWRRWWPERVCVEFLDDKIQAGYDALERREAVIAATIWLDAWSDVVRLGDLTGIDSIREFDGRFSMCQSLFNWSQDLEDALGNAGREDPEMLRARVAVCEVALRRFPDERGLMVENRRRALAESYFELGETDRAEALFERWLAVDPCWGWGWIGWADLHFFANNRPKDQGMSYCAAATRRPASGAGRTSPTGSCSCTERPGVMRRLTRSRLRPSESALPAPASASDRRSIWRTPVTAPSSATRQRHL